MVILPVLAMLGIIESKKELRPGQAGPWDALVKFVEKTPWIVLVGLVLIYFGLKVLGVSLPF
jgi:uncharacterized membrane protein YdfJ with MMPL/SSD domain